MKSLFRSSILCSLLCLVLLVFASYVNAGPRCATCSGRVSAASYASYAPTTQYVRATQNASFCGPCAYAGVPCAPGNCIACTDGCSTGCPGANTFAGGSDIVPARGGSLVPCATCPGGFAFVPTGMQLPSATAPVQHGPGPGWTCDPVTGICYPPGFSPPNRPRPGTVSGSVLLEKIEEGERVKHPANPAGLFPAGTGTIQMVLPLNSGRGKVYTVKCDQTGKTLPVAFEDGELWKH